MTITHRDTGEELMTCRECKWFRAVSSVGQCRRFPHTRADHNEVGQWQFQHADSIHCGEFSEGKFQFQVKP